MVIVGSQGGEMCSVLGGSISIEVHLNHHIIDHDYHDYDYDGNDDDYDRSDDDYDGSDDDYHDYDYDHDDHDDYHGLSVANMAIESCTAWRRVHLVSHS